MKESMRIVFVYLINVILVCVIAVRVSSIDSDKAHLIFLFYYSALLVLNFAIGFILKLMKQTFYKRFRMLCIWMLCLFIPLYIIVITM